MLDNFKPLGAFIENTIRPLLEESHWLIDELNKNGIPITSDNISKLIKVVAKIHLQTMLFQLIQCTITTGLVLFTLWKIAPSLFRS